MKYGILSLAGLLVAIGVYGLFIYESDQAPEAVIGKTRVTNISVETSSSTKKDEMDEETNGDVTNSSESLAKKVNSYQSEAYKFSFTYPKYAKLTEFTKDMLLVEGANSGGLVDIAVVTNEFRDVESVSALVYVETRLRCDADGSEGTVRCGEVVESEEYVSDAGAEGEKFFLAKIETNAEGEEEVSTYGPIYAFPISGSIEDASLGALIIAPPLGAEEASVGLLDSIVSSLEI